MKCPKCETTENIKWLLRHQSIDENDEGTNANVITILCTECGHNETVFIEEYLGDIFTSWSETPQNSNGNGLMGGGIGSLFGGLMGAMGSNNFIPEPEPTGWRSATNAAKEIRDRNRMFAGPVEMEPPQDNDVIEVEPDEEVSIN